MRSANFVLVSRFLHAHPSIEAEVVVDDALVDMVSGGFDAGVRFGESIDADMIAIPIGSRRRFAVVGSSDHFERHERPAIPYELKDHPCIRHLYASGAFYRWECERGGIAMDIEVEGRLTLGDQDIMLAAAAKGSGLAYLFEDQVRSALVDGRLAGLLDDWCSYSPGSSTITRAATARRAFGDFIKAVRPWDGR
jgi:DNA-binding transcriptional LysR family regulator